MYILLIDKYIFKYQIWCIIEYNLESGLKV